MTDPTHIDDDDHSTDPLAMSSDDDHQACLIELKQLLDSRRDEIERLRRSNRPLLPIFNDDGSMRTLEEASNPFIPEIQDFAFKLNFKHYPHAFLKMEYKLQARCNKVGVTYIRPKITDSVQDTSKRKATLNRAIKTAKQNLSRKGMTKEERKKASVKQMEYRQNKISNESEGEG
jgi:hypothetical protein